MNCPGGMLVYKNSLHSYKDLPVRIAEIANDFRYEADLYGNNVNRTMQQDKSRNPFNTDKLYIYFNAYDFRTKRFKPDKYILELEQKQDICKAKFVDHHDKRVVILLVLQL